MPPLISVLIPVYNTEPYLRECLDSVLGQTYTNLELLIVDDGSTDGSGVICDEYAAADVRVRVIHRENGGVSSARNLLLAEARGEYITWLDSDDVCAADMVEYLYSGLIKYGADISQCGQTQSYRSFTERSSDNGVCVFSGDQALDAVLKGRINQRVATKLYSSAVLKDASFHEDLVVGEDSCMIFELCVKQYTTVTLNSIKYYYRVREQSLIHSANRLLVYKAHRRIISLVQSDHDAYGFFAYAQAHFFFMSLDVQRSLNSENMTVASEILLTLRENIRAALQCRYVGFLGKTEALFLCSGKPWSWRFALLCQRIFEYRSERRLR